MTPPRISDILRHAAIVVVLGLAALFVLSLVRKHRERRELANELRSVLSESHYFRQFYAEDAQRALLRAVHLLHRAEADGRNPAEAVERALGGGGGALLDRADTQSSAGPTRAQSLAAATLLANHENCRKLGLLDHDESLADLGRGTAPVIRAGPAAGQPAVIRTVIDPGLAPGLDKVLANLEIGPPRAPDHTPGDVEVAAARRLARELEEAGIIESVALERILAHYAAHQ